MDISRKNHYLVIDKNRREKLDEARIKLEKERIKKKIKKLEKELKKRKVK